MKRILFFTGNVFPCYAGDSIFSAGIIDALSQKYAIDVLTFGESEKIIYDENYLRIKNKLASIKILNHSPRRVSNYYLYFKYKHKLHLHSDNMVLELKKLISNYQYDYIIIDHLRMFSMYKSIEHIIDRSKTKIILLAHNVENRNLNEYVKYTKQFRKKAYEMLLNLGLKRFEKNAIDSVDYLWGLCEEDLSELKDLIKDVNNPSRVIRPYFQFKRVKSDEEIGKRYYNLLFLGSMSWYPNIQGIEYFVNNIFSKVLKEDDRYKLYVVGSKPDVRVQQLQSERVIITGAVPSVDEYIRKCDLVVVPNKLGSGVKIKIMESILKGIPVIVFKESSVGYPEELFKGGFCVQDDNEFARSILQINNDISKKIEFIRNAQNVLTKANICF